MKEKVSKEEFDKLWHKHETMMVVLCTILELDYFEADESDVEEAVRKLKEKC
jgi:hypothetical protein